ncbi:MAG: NERD domain-containing protein [Clostridia bacterium]|nr:NERD domain-containing protein [Clostridia bacterium]
MNFFIILVVIIIAVCMLALILSDHRKSKKGRDAELKVSSCLKKIARKEQIIVMNNVYLPLYDGTCEVDHIVFGSFGVLSVETKGVSGTISGSGKHLEHKIGSKIYKMYNPQMQNQTHVNCIKYHLRKSRINVPVYGVVVFTASDVVFDKSIGISINDLERYIMKLPHASCNVHKTAAAIQNIRVYNPFKKISHNRKIASIKDDEEM